MNTRPSHFRHVRTERHRVDHLNGANTKFHSLKKICDLFRLLLYPMEIVSLLALFTMTHNRNQLPKSFLTLDDIVSVVSLKDCILEKVYISFDS